MDKRALFTVLAGLCLTALSVSMPPTAAGSPVGKEMPGFSIASGKEETLTDRMVRGHVLVLFYESKETTEKNRELKKFLNAFYSSQSREVQRIVFRLPVINCKSAVWPITGVWKSSLRKHTKKEGYTIYGDWDGRMAINYGFRQDDTNLMIIDKKGIIRFFKSGFIDQSQYNGIRKLLTELVEQ